VSTPTEPVNRRIGDAFHVMDRVLGPSYFLRPIEGKTVRLQAWGTDRVVCTFDIPLKGNYDSKVSYAVGQELAKGNLNGLRWMAA
jgi:hypothetical protein